MSQTAFGFDPEQDRLWLLYDTEHPRIWVTRRVAQAIATSVTQLVEQTATGMSDNSAQRVQMEHRIAVTETPEGESYYPYKVQVESREDLSEQGFTLCRGLSAQINARGGQITLSTEESEVKFDFNRYDLHLWLRAFRMAVQEANWNLSPGFPPWLEEPLLPPSIQQLIGQPIPPELRLEKDDPNSPAPP